MKFFTENKLKEIADNYKSAKNKIFVDEATLINEDNISLKSLNKTYDIFLSHSSLDKKVIYGIKALFEQKGYSVYVDWIDDGNLLDRNNVTSATAQVLRERMKKSKTLVYAHSNNSPVSKWMPWELGYFDGYKGKVSIFPIIKNEGETFKGQEYLGLYPFIDTSKNSLSSNVWINSGDSKIIFNEDKSFIELGKWIA